MLCAAHAVAQSAELSLVEELRLGRFEGSGPDVFGDIHDLAVDPEGRIYVIDAGWRDVRLFDREGEFVRRLAPEGEGPGERRYWNIGTTLVTWDVHRGRLWVDDGLHLSVLDSLGLEYARSTRLPLSTDLDREPYGTVVQIDPGGRVYEFQQISEERADYTIALVAVDSAYGMVAEQSLLIESSEVTDGPGETTATPGGSVTVSRATVAPSLIVWTVSPAGRLWIANIGEKRVRNVALTGETLRSVSFDGVPGDAAWAELDVSPEGWFWIRHKADSAESSTWEVLDNCGNHVGSASTPHAVSATEAGAGGSIHVLASGAFDLDYVLRLQLTARVTRRSC